MENEDQFSVAKLQTVALPLKSMYVVDGLHHSHKGILLCSNGKVYEWDNFEWRDISPAGSYHSYDAGRLSKANAITVKDENDEVHLATKEDMAAAWRLSRTKISSNSPGIACLCGGEQQFLLTDDMRGCVLVVNQQGQALSTHGQGVLSHPHYVVVGARGEIIVSDYGIDDIAILHSDGNLKYWLRQRNTLSREILATPFGMCTDVNGTIFVASYGSHKILMFTPGGDFIRTIWSATDGLQHPTAICVSEDGDLLVADRRGVHMLQYRI